MALPRFAVVDLETSGLDTRRHRILQLGLVVVDDGGRVSSEWSSFVSFAGRSSGSAATEVHGITRRTLRGAPQLDATLDELAAASTARSSPHTTPRSTASSSFGRSGGARQTMRCAPACSAGCAHVTMSRRLDPDRLLSHRLSDVCERYGVSLDRPHDALGDAEATAEVLPHLLAAHHITDVAQLEPFFVR